ncbi:unnamed protein product [Clonostachys rosea]|uniref:Zn(2)-C6 fungal-type domain-containing protein n=1 Tax=Bionectria ochroleuca TaxID=29856 RepID=A0ABY6UM94_BIOOC|nr:unnamed protein product [Clonostachys rosea]
MDTDPDDHSLLSNAKRRRALRKGTRSCWECRRRKIRCTYASPSDEACIGCSKRCSICISQEFPDQTTTPVARSRLVGERIGRVEALVQGLVKLTGSPTSAASESVHLVSVRDGGAQSGGGGGGIPTPGSPHHTPLCASSVAEGNSGNTPSSDTDGAISPVGEVSHSQGNLDKISRHLLDMYPSASDMKVVFDSCSVLSTYFTKLLVKPYQELGDSELKCMDELTARHTHQTHPVLIARQMLQIAIVLQQAGHNTHQGWKRLSEPAATLTERLADTAIRLVTKNDDMMGSLEAIVCVLLESIYQSNRGDLRRSWLTIRRAIGIAQLGNIHRRNRQSLLSIDPTNSIDPQFLWHRLMYADRFVSLMLGLSQASTDAAMASDAMMKNETDMGRLERLESAAASRILERNEHGPSPDDLSVTLDIDADLQRAASTMPSRWWLAPTLTTVEGDVQLFWEISKLLAQINHYNLLNQLHLPYMLSSSNPENAQQRHRYAYSRITCVSASRELLTRYAAFRKFNKVAYCCRVLEFVALLASLTLLMAHLDGHRAARQGREDSTNVLAHLRFSDRAIMEQVLDGMQQLGLVSGGGEDVMSARSAALLRHLLDFEEDAARGRRYSIGKDLEDTGRDGGSHTVVGDFTSRSGIFQMWVPYVGSVSITLDGRVAKRSVISSQMPGEETLDIHGAPMETAHGSAAHSAQPSEFGASDFVGYSATFPAQHPHAGITLGAEQWAFQGVDTAFFENLMRESNFQLNNEAVNPWF